MSSMRVAAIVVIALLAPSACSADGGSGDDPSTSQSSVDTSSTTAPPAEEVLRIATWNTLGGIFEGPTGLFENRHAEVGDQLRGRTDVAGLQEVQQVQADLVASRFAGIRRRCAVAVAGGPTIARPGRCVWALKHNPVIIPAEGHAIVSRRPLRDAVAGVLSGDEYAETSSERRIYLAATVPGDTVDLRVYDTHLSTDCSERSEQAQRLLAVIDAERARFARPTRAVIVGDLNTEPQGDECGTGDDSLIAAFAAAGFVTAWDGRCRAYCDLATGAGLAECGVSGGDTESVLDDPDRFAGCGFTYRQKANWERTTDRPEVPYRTIDYVLVEAGGIEFDGYERPWFTGEWSPGTLTPDQAAFERFLAVSDHVPVFATIRVQA